MKIVYLLLGLIFFVIVVLIIRQKKKRKASFNPGATNQIHKHELPLDCNQKDYDKNFQDLTEEQSTTVREESCNNNFTPTVPEKTQIQVEQEKNKSLESHENEENGLLTDITVTTEEIQDGKGKILSGGGRPRGKTIGEAGKIATHVKKIKPEIVCWYKNRRWYIGLDLSENYPKDSTIIVKHDSDFIEKNNKGEYKLNKIMGNIHVDLNDNNTQFDLPLAQEEKPYLIFKLYGENLEYGRLMRKTTIGSFLIILPNNMKCPNQSSAPTSIEGFVAYNILFDEKIQALCFITTEDKSISIPSNVSLFRLVGEYVVDAHEEMGTLYVKTPPKITASNVEIWNNVNMIILGREGKREKGWKIYLEPRANQKEHDLGEDFLQRPSGWYYIRVYDNNYELFESFDFRFVKSLKSISINSRSIIPGIDGHYQAMIEFTHELNFNISLHEPTLTSELVQSLPERTKIEIPPIQQWDRTKWKVNKDTEFEVDIELLIERIWWTIAEEENEQNTYIWYDKPLDLTRDIFVATSKTQIIIRLPKFRWEREIQIGFERWRSRTYYVEVTNQDVIIPLNHFEVMKEFREKNKDHILKLWIKTQKNEELETPIALIHKETTTERRHSKLGKNRKRVKRYIKRLCKYVPDSVCCKFLSEEYEKLKDISYNFSDIGCLIILSWEILKKNKMKIVGRKKRWIKTLVERANLKPEKMNNLRNRYIQELNKLNNESN